jgi:hypothetical protein
LDHGRSWGVAIHLLGLRRKALNDRIDHFVVLDL